MIPTVLCERLILRPHTTANVSRLHSWHNDPEILAMCSDDLNPPSIEKSRATVERWQKGDEDILHLAIHLRASQQLIGYLHIAMIDRQHSRCHIGMVIGERAHWGNGYGTEALHTAVQYSFDTLDMHRIGAETYATNIRSQRMLIRVGFRHEGILRERLKRDVFVDEYVYGLLRSEYRR